MTEINFPPGSIGARETQKLCVETQDGKKTVFQKTSISIALPDGSQIIGHEITRYSDDDQNLLAPSQAVFSCEIEERPKFLKSKESCENKALSTNSITRCIECRLIMCRKHTKPDRLCPKCRRKNFWKKVFTLDDE